MVTPGSNNVYLDVSLLSLIFKLNLLKIKKKFTQAKSYQEQAISENFNRTGKCNYQLANDNFINSYGCFALPKNSPHTQTISRG